MESESVFGGWSFVPPRKSHEKDSPCIPDVTWSNFEKVPKSYLAVINCPTGRALKSQERHVWTSLPKSVIFFNNKRLKNLQM